MLTVAEFADRMRVSRGLVYAMIRRGEVRAVRCVVTMTRSALTTALTLVESGEVGLAPDHRLTLAPVALLVPDGRRAAFPGGTSSVEHRSRSSDPVARFWAKVEQSGLFDCWNWTAVLDERGYGKFRDFPDRYPEHAHRVAWRYANGPIPPGLVVMHDCDNRRCVNPAHLRLGTQADNIRDRSEKGRTRNGVTGRLVA